MAEPIRVVHYLNQFFGGIGGEAAAGAPPRVQDGPVGPGRLLEQAAPGLTVAGTVLCGDNYFVEHRAEALARILEGVRRYAPEALLAGPAFASGRYGEACAAVAEAVQSELGIPVITGLSPQSPAAAMYRRSLPIVQTGDSAADMKVSLTRMAAVLAKMARGEDLAPEDQGWLLKRGLKQNALRGETAAERAVALVLAKHRGEPYHTELPPVAFERVPPAPPAAEGVPLVAVITDGGLILRGNPEGMSSGRSTRWCRVDAGGWDRLAPEHVEVFHFGYDTRWVEADPNRLVPWDALRAHERAGRLRLHPVIYSTAGAGTAMADAARFGREIASELRAAGVQAAILTST